MDESGGHDEILTQLQTIVPSLPVESAIGLLESVKWNLDEAINIALAMDLSSTVGDESISNAAAGGVGGFVENEDVELLEPPTQASATESLSTRSTPLQTISNGSGAVGGTAAGSSSSSSTNPWEQLMFNHDAEPQQTSSVNNINNETSSFVRATRTSMSSNNHGSIVGDVSAIAGSSSSSSSDAYSFEIKYKGRTINLADIRQNETCGEIEHRIAEAICGVNPDDLVISGWKSGIPDFKPPPSLPIQDLDLSRKTKLTVTLKDDAKEGTSAESNNKINPELLVKRYKFRITISRSNGQETEEEMSLPGNTTIAEMKQTVDGLTSISPSKQLWTPNMASDNDRVIAGCPWPDEVDSFIPLHLKQMTNTKKPNWFPKESEMSDSENEMDDSQGTIDFVDEEADNSTALPLIPEGLGQEPLEAIHNFVTVFESRFPAMIHPQFFHGSLEMALREAIGEESGHERRPLALYLHNDNAVAANIFCERVLCADQFQTLLSANFVVWPWDLTLKANSKILEEWIKKLLGNGGLNMDQDDQARGGNMLLPNAYGHPNPLMMVGGNGTDAIVRSVLNNVDAAPYIILIGRNKNNNEFLGQIKGSSTVEEAMNVCMEAMELQHSYIQQEQIEKAGQIEREAFRKDQEDMYQESLRKDKEMEEKRQKDELEKKAAQKREAMQKEEHEIQLRFPDGSKVVRRFLAKDKLKDLLNFAGSKGYKVEQFKFLTSYPKRDLGTLEAEDSLEDLKLTREVVTVDEK